MALEADAKALADIESRLKRHEGVKRLGEHVGDGSQRGRTDHGETRPSIEEGEEPVEPAGADEAYLDVRGTEHLFGTPEEIAAAIKRRVREEMQL